MTRNEYEQAYVGGFRRTIAVLRRLGAAPDDALELAQAAWVRAWERLSTLRDDICIQSWVEKIARNAHLDHSLRSRRLTVLDSAAAESRISSSNVLAAIDIDRALEDCTPSQRFLLNAVYKQGQSACEVAALLKVSVGAVHHRLSRARSALRRAMNAR